MFANLESFISCVHLQLVCSNFFTDLWWCRHSVVCFKKPLRGLLPDNHILLIEHLRFVASCSVLHTIASLHNIFCTVVCQGSLSPGCRLPADGGGGGAQDVALGQAEKDLEQIRQSCIKRVAQELHEEDYWRFRRSFSPGVCLSPMRLAATAAMAIAAGMLSSPQ
jgi:hypothetical protein